MQNLIAGLPLPVRWAREKSSKFMTADNAISAVDSLNDVVISAYDNDKAEDEDYSPPQPINGKAEFEKYVRMHISHRDSLQTGQKIVVIISFLVRSDGSIEKLMWKEVLINHFQMKPSGLSTMDLHGNLLKKMEGFQRIR